VISPLKSAAKLRSFSHSAKFIFPCREKFVFLQTEIRKTIVMESHVRQPFNPAQLELLSTMASLTTEADLIELKQAIARFFAERADREMERLWDEGTINEETLKAWEHEHMRTPYRKNNTVSI
jgi:hypothetical protein